MVLQMFTNSWDQIFVGICVYLFACISRTSGTGVDNYSFSRSIISFKK